MYLAMQLCYYLAFKGKICSLSQGSLAERISIAGRKAVGSRVDFSGSWGLGSLIVWLPLQGKSSEAYHQQTFPRDISD